MHVLHNHLKKKHELSPKDVYIYIYVGFDNLVPVPIFWGGFERSQQRSQVLVVRLRVL